MAVCFYYFVWLSDLQIIVLVEIKSEGTFGQLLRCWVSSSPILIFSCLCTEPYIVNVAVVFVESRIYFIFLLNLLFPITLVKREPDLICEESDLLL